MQTFRNTCTHCPGSKYCKDWVTWVHSLFKTTFIFTFPFSVSFKILTHKHSSNFEEFTDSTFLSFYHRASAKNNWLLNPWPSPSLTLLSIQYLLTWLTRPWCAAPKSTHKKKKKKPSVAQEKNIYLQPSIFFGTEHAWNPRFTSLFRQFIADHLCWQETTKTMTAEVKDYTTSVHISADADRPSAPLCLQATFSQTTDWLSLFQWSVSHSLARSLSFFFTFSSLWTLYPWLPVYHLLCPYKICSQ